MVLIGVLESLGEVLLGRDGTRWLLGNVFEVNKLEDITQE